MTEFLQFIDLGDGAAVLALLIIGWVKLHSRILRLEVLINNDLKHRLEILERYMNLEDTE